MRNPNSFEFVVFDIETIGCPNWWEDDPTEIAAIRCRGDQVLERFQTLVHPHSSITRSATLITGITNEMVSDAPEVRDVLPDFKDFVANLPIMGWNLISFDIPRIQWNMHYYMDQMLTNSLIDLMRVARSKVMGPEDYKQPSVARFFGVDASHAHRALADCLTCHGIYIEMLSEGHASAEDIVDSQKRWTPGESFLSRYVMEEDTRRCYPNILTLRGGRRRILADRAHPLYGRRCVFSRDLTLLTRYDAERVVAQCGGIVQRSVTRNTDLLVCGNIPSVRQKGGQTQKHAKACALQAQGQNIQIITEEEFYKLLEQCV